MSLVHSSGNSYIHVECGLHDICSPTFLCLFFGQGNEQDKLTWANDCLRTLTECSLAGNCASNFFYSFLNHLGCYKNCSYFAPNLLDSLPHILLTQKIRTYRAFISFKFFHVSTKHVQLGCVWVCDLRSMIIYLHQWILHLNYSFYTFTPIWMLT